MFRSCLFFVPPEHLLPLRGTLLRYPPGPVQALQGRLRLHPERGEPRRHRPGRAALSHEPGVSPAPHVQFVTRRCPRVQVAAVNLLLLGAGGKGAAACGETGGSSGENVTVGGRSGGCRFLSASCFIVLYRGLPHSPAPRSSPTWRLSPPSPLCRCCGMVPLCTAVFNSFFFSFHPTPPRPAPPLSPVCSRRGNRR